MKKNIIKIMVAVFMLLGILQVIGVKDKAYAAEPVLRVDGQAYDMSQDVSGDGWSFSSSSRMLTLDNYKGGAIYANMSLYINAYGENVITSTDDDYYGIYVDDAVLQINGESYETTSLTINMENRSSASDYCAIRCEDFIGTNIELNINLSNNKSNCTLYGIKAESSLKDVDLTSASLSILNTGEDKDGQIFRAIYGRLEKRGEGDVYINVGKSSWKYGCGFGLEVYGPGETTVIATHAVTKGIKAWYHAGKINIFGTVYSDPYSGGFEMADNKDVVSPEACIVYDNYLTDPVTLEPLTECVIDTVENKEIKVVDSTAWDISGLTMGEQMYGAWMPGCTGVNYSLVRVKEGNSLPKGLSIDISGYMSGTPMLEYDSQDVVLEVWTGTESKYLTIHIDEVYDPYPITGVTLSKEEIICDIGYTDSLSATITPNKAINKNISFESSNPDVVKVDKTTGAIEALASGKAIITVTTESRKKTATCEVYVKEVTPTAMVEDVYITGLVGNATYSIDGVAKTTDALGRILIENAWINKTVKIIKTNADSKCNSDALELEVVDIRKDISELKKDASITTKCVFDKKAKTPKVSVKGLTEGKDFTVTYSNNVNAGTASATVKGIGMYKGSFVINFTIEPAVIKGIDNRKIKMVYTGKVIHMPLYGYPAGATVTYSRTPDGKYSKTIPSMVDVGKEVVYYKVEMPNYKTVYGSYYMQVIPLDASKFNVSLKNYTFTYTGKKITPGVIVLDQNGKKMSSKYYKVKLLSDGKNVGTHDIKIEFVGNYSGNARLEFKIIPKKIVINKIQVKKDVATVKWNKITNDISGYEIQVSKTKTFKTKTVVTIKNNKVVSTKVSKLATGKLYIRMRAYRIVNGKKYYSAWSAIKIMTVKK